MILEVFYMDYPDKIAEEIFSNTHFMIAYMDKEFNFIRVNKAYAEANGKNSEYFINKNHFELFPNLENERIFKNVVETGESYSAYARPFEHPYLGLTYWDWDLQPIKDAAGKVKNLILSLINVTPYKFDEKRFKRDQSRELEKLVEERARDLENEINEHKKVAEKLRESENRYHSLFEDNHATMLFIDPDTGDIVDANPAASSFYGYDIEELKKMKITDINVLTEEEVFNEMQKARIKKKNYFSFKHRLASGEIRNVDTYSGPITFSGRNILYSIVHDVTEREKAQKALQMERELLGTIIDAIPVMITIYTPSVENIQVNKAFEKITGWSNEEIQELDIMEAVYPDPDYRQEVAEFMNSLSGWKDITMTIKNGSKIASSWANVPIPDGRQVGIGIDISQRKQMEKELREAHDKLEEKVQERTIELEEAYEALKENEMQLKDLVADLERSNEELRSFAYITSHDLQEPLRTIASFSQLLERRYKGRLDSDADEFLDFIINAAVRMKEMIQGLLDYSRVEREGKKFIKTDMNLKLEKAVSNLRSAIDESSAIITHDDLPTVSAEPDQMVRVFQNIIGNAIKFRKADEQLKIHISVRIDKKRREWIFSVSDNGIGMEEKYADRIFEVFKRLHTVDKYEGAGIGLAIVKRIIDAHGGYIWVESKLGKGSTFYFTIPFKQS